MRAAGLEPQVRTYNVMLKLWARQKSKQARALMDQTVEEMLEKGGKSAPTVTTVNTLLDAHGKGADPERARHWFDRMEELGLRADLITFNIMLACYGVLHVGYPVRVGRQGAGWRVGVGDQWDAARSRPHS